MKKEALEGTRRVLIPRIAFGNVISGIQALVGIHLSRIAGVGCNLPIAQRTAWLPVRAPRACTHSSWRKRYHRRSAPRRARVFNLD
jgi:hypothetical protein